MFFYIYGVLLIISIAVLVWMASKNYNNIDTFYWTIVVIIPIILLGYALKAGANSIDDAKLAFCFLYLDSTVLFMVTLLSFFKGLGIRMKTWIKILAYVICFAHLVCVWLCKDNTLYYATFEIRKTALGTATTMTDGPLKITHYIYLAIVVLAFTGGLIYALRKVKDYSRKYVGSYTILMAVCILCYVLETVCKFSFSVLPFLYLTGEVLLAAEYENLHSHDMDCVVVEQKQDASIRGYVAFGMQKQLLCYNETAVEYIPEIKGKRIDEVIEDETGKLTGLFYPLIDKYEAEGSATSDISPDDGAIYRCTVTYFYMHKGGQPRGYLIEIQDVTAEQGYMNLIKQFAESMEKDVNEKTSHIRYIQQKVVLGMATIIENRDMNTGGHVRRTSDIIKIIVDEMMRQHVADIDENYADEIVRSAPMHDLGKISIDNNILNKPGKLTDEEYAIMKTHSAKSGEIVLAILSGVESPHFVQTAYCLARFHHERWDGKGYPERLAEYEIPLEARIMAVADVYDALVSKRCYKEPMSFEKAAQIMIEGMGSQFDPMMKPVFEGCREQLEAYYTEHSEE